MYTCFWTRHNLSQRTGISKPWTQALVGIRGTLMIWEWRQGVLESQDEIRITAPQLRAYVPEEASSRIQPHLSIGTLGNTRPKVLARWRLPAGLFPTNRDDVVKSWQQALDCLETLPALGPARLNLLGIHTTVEPKQHRAFQATPLDPMAWQIGHDHAGYTPIVFAKGIEGGVCWQDHNGGVRLMVQGGVPLDPHRPWREWKAIVNPLLTINIGPEPPEGRTVAAQIERAFGATARQSLNDLGQAMFLAGANQHSWIIDQEEDRISARALGRSGTVYESIWTKREFEHILQGCCLGDFSHRPQSWGNGCRTIALYMNHYSVQLASSHARLQALNRLQRKGITLPRLAPP